MKIPVLDHGYVELIECWGSGQAERLERSREWYDVDHEVGIIEAARQSTQGSFRGWEDRLCEDEGCDATPRDIAHEHPGDANLLRYLYCHNHLTPFEFSGMVIEVQAPIMVFREWHRHRTQSYNEMSARYAPLPDLYYHCSVDEVIQRSRIAAEAKDKQHAAAGWSKLDEWAILEWVKEDARLSKVLEAHYQRGLAIGIPKELARKKMPVDHFTRMRAAANLRNWIGFLALRTPHNVMPEMRKYAEAVAQLVAAKFPRTWKQFDERRSSSSS